MGHYVVICPESLRWESFKFSLLHETPTDNHVGSSILITICLKSLHNKLRPPQDRMTIFVVDSCSHRSGGGACHN